MTVHPARPAKTKQLLDDVLAELLATVNQSDPLDSAIVAAVEGAALIATAAEAVGRPGGEDPAVDIARQALGAMRASVVATTVSVRVLADRQRTRRDVSPAGSELSRQ